MIAYYAHSHGFGHSNTAQEFCKALSESSLIITSSNFKFVDGLNVVKVANEDLESSVYEKTNFNLPKYAHYIPKSLGKLTLRNFQILECCVSNQVTFAMVDVSVETAIQFRIAGVPYAYNKMLGDRSDEPHKMAFEASEFLFAYYPIEMDMNRNLNQVVKTYYLGFLSRFKYRTNKTAAIFSETNPLKILLINGKGGTQLTKEMIVLIGNQKPDSQFTVIGDMSFDEISNISVVDHSDNLEDTIMSHDVVMASCGLNLTSEILALKNKFIAFPEDRPYSEQKSILKGLKKNKLAVELDFNNIQKSLDEFQQIPYNKDLKSFFGTMDDFKNIPELKLYL